MDDLTAAISEDFARVHDRMRAVVKDLDQVQLERAPADGENSIAILVTHSLGAELVWLNRAADQPFPRDRDAEFRARGSAAELTAKIDATAPQVEDLVRRSEAMGWETPRTLPSGERRSVAFCVIRALTHANEHVAHAELTRNLLTRSSRPR